MLRGGNTLAYSPMPRKYVPRPPKPPTERVFPCCIACGARLAPRWFEEGRAVLPYRWGFSMSFGGRGRIVFGTEYQVRDQPYATVVKSFGKKHAERMAAAIFGAGVELHRAGWPIPEAISHAREIDVLGRRLEAKEADLAARKAEIARLKVFETWWKREGHKHVSLKAPKLATKSTLEHVAAPRPVQPRFGAAPRLELPPVAFGKSTLEKIG